MRRLRPLFGDRRVRQHGDPSGHQVAVLAHERGKVQPAEDQAPRYQLRIDLTTEGDVAAALASLLVTQPEVLTIGYVQVQERPSTVRLT